MTKPKAQRAKYVEAAWIGEFEFSNLGRQKLEKHFSTEVIKKIEKAVAEHKYLIHPHIQGRPTSSEIKANLSQIQKKASELTQALRSLDIYSKAQLGGVMAREKIAGRLDLDLSVLESDIDSLGVIAAAAAARTSGNTGAGQRKPGQRPVPAAALVGQVAILANQAGIKVNDSPNGAFVEICQTIVDDGGMPSDVKVNDIRGSIRAYLGKQR
jgi:hypothetical protein